MGNEAVEESVRTLWTPDALMKTYLEGINCWVMRKDDDQNDRITEYKKDVKEKEC